MDNVRKLFPEKWDPIFNEIKEYVKQAPEEDEDWLVTINAECITIQNEIGKKFREFDPELYQPKDKVK